MNRVARQKSRVESHPISDCQSAIRGSLLAPRPSFTLIELLVSILIISILASALLGVAATASETAREAKTRNIIARIHTLLMEQYDTYKSRRVKVRQSVLDAINNDTTTSPAQKGYLRQEAYLYAMRELMMIEMPSRW
ncbi:MAG TPA: type II secretion system protein, partial [Pyrinomonadaceae bacterium]